MAKYFQIPFAMNGDRKEIPTDKQEDGSISFDEGYGLDYQKNKQTDPTAKDINRESFNSILHDITGAIGEIQRSGVATWTNEISYSKGATIIHNGAVYTSTINANKNEPPHASWSSLDLSVYRKKDDLLFNGMMQVQATDDVGTGVFLFDKDNNPRGQMTSNSNGLQFAQNHLDGTSQTFTLPKVGTGGELVINNNPNLFDNYETLDEARASTTNSPYMYVKYHSASRKTGGGLYCRTSANLTDNNGSRIVTSSGVSYEIEPPLRSRVETFGVIGDNTTDNTAHLQNMLDFIGSSVPFHSRIVNFGAGGFVLNDDIQIPKALLNLQFVGVGGMACRLVYRGVDKETAVLNVEAAMFKIRGIRLTYLNARPNSNQIKKIGLNFFRKKGETIDIDCEIEDCYIAGFNVAVKHTGRGLWLHNSAVAQCVNVLELDFPNEEDIAETSGTGVSGLYKNAWRAIRVNDCRFHSITQQAVKNTGSNAHILNGFQMTDCLNDIGNGWFNGHLGVNALITNLQTLNGGDYTQMILTGGIDFTIDGILSNYSVDRSLPVNTINMNGVFKGVMSNLNLGGGSSHVIRADLRDSDIKFSNVVMHSLNTGTVYGMYFSSLNNSIVEIVEASVLGSGSAVVAVNGFVNSDLKAHQLSGANSTIVSTQGVDLGFTGVSTRGGSIIPNTVASLGLSNKPFNNLYVINAPNVTSDARKKSDIRPIDDKYLKVIADLPFKQFNLIGQDGTRFGIIAQEWIAVCEKHGVDPYSTGVLVGSNQEGYAIRYGELQNLFNAYILTKLK